ncbi:MAG: GIY-YIG nuclease family protein [Candidatus Omnitrophica bacterium]|nr:GIY-YIG nuclease family protein [Candidatus Omnitrophota bacterium]
MKKRKVVRSGKFYVYILKCNDGAYYTGYTNDLNRRVEEHNAAKASRCTRARLPVELVWRKEYTYLKNAMREESRIKRMTRAQKEKLVSR